MYLYDIILSVGFQLEVFCTLGVCSWPRWGGSRVPWVKRLCSEAFGGKGLSTTMNQEARGCRVVEHDTVELFLDHCQGICGPYYVGWSILNLFHCEFLGSWPPKMCTFSNQTRTPKNPWKLFPLNFVNSDTAFVSGECRQRMCTSSCHPFSSLQGPWFWGQRLLPLWHLHQLVGLWGWCSVGWEFRKHRGREWRKEGGGGGAIMEKRWPVRMPIPYLTSKKKRWVFCVLIGNDDLIPKGERHHGTW